MKRRIVLATDSLDPSGMGEHMLILGSGLREEFDVLVAAPPCPMGDKLLRRAAERGLAIKAIDPGQPAQVRRWIERLGADLVHVHAGIGWEGHGLVRAARAAGVRVVRTEHLPYLLTDVVQQAAYRAMLLSLDARIAVSQTVAQTHAGHGDGPMHVVRNGVAAAQPQRDRTVVRQELGISNDDLLVLTVARFTAQKGHDLLLAAVPDVLARHPQAQIVLVGDGPEQEAIRSAIADQGLGGNVRVLSARSDIPDLLAAADLFVLPSRFEGLPLVLLEAASASLPIVATSNGGTAEALGSDHRFLVPPDNAEALASAITQALSDRPAATGAAEMAKQRFSQRFDAERMVRQTAVIYRSVLTQTTQGAHA